MKAFEKKGQEVVNVYAFDRLQEKKNLPYCYKFKAMDEIPTKLAELAVCGVSSWDINEMNAGTCQV